MCLVLCKTRRDTNSQGKFQRRGYLGQDVWEEEGKPRDIRKCPASLGAVGRLEGAGRKITDRSGPGVKTH